MANKRIIALTEATVVDRNDYIPLDQSARGTRKIALGTLLDNIITIESGVLIIRSNETEETQNGN